MIKKKYVALLRNSFIFFLIIQLQNTLICASVKPENTSSDLLKQIHSTPAALHEIITFTAPELKMTTTLMDYETTNSCLENTKAVKIKKDWTFITYMAADNDLAPFARRNLKQQTDVGSNKYINIVTQLDTRIPGNKKITKRYYVEKDKLIITNQNDPNSQKMDSGLPATLIDCCKWAIENFPAHNYALVLWNHGTGAIGIGPRRRSINTSPLFMFNPSNNLLELDRSIPFIDFVQNAYGVEHKAICFDDSTGHYLSNEDLENALNIICSTFLHGKKFSIICFDACLMSMIEIANIIKNYAHYMTASEEVEPGTGYDYFKVLSPFLTNSLDQKNFAKHIIDSYQATYGPITNDFTQAALDLTGIANLEANIDKVANLLIEALKIQKNNIVKEALKLCRHRLYCTHFDEPSYIDLQHFYKNIQAHYKKFEFNNNEHGKRLRTELEAALSAGLILIKNIVIANTAGKNISQASGISIYFPEKRIHQSYTQSSFAQSNKWFTFIRYYLSMP